MGAELRALYFGPCISGALGALGALNGARRGLPGREARPPGLPVFLGSEAGQGVGAGMWGLPARVLSAAAQAGECEGRDSSSAPGSAPDGASYTLPARTTPGGPAPAICAQPGPGGLRSPRPRGSRSAGAPRRRRPGASGCNGINPSAEAPGRRSPAAAATGPSAAASATGGTAGPSRCSRDAGPSADTAPYSGPLRFPGRRPPGRP